jgi:hypothetical protein
MPFLSACPVFSVILWVPQPQEERELKAEPIPHARLLFKAPSSLRSWEISQHLRMEETEAQR